MIIKTKFEIGDIVGVFIDSKFFITRVVAVSTQYTRPDMGYVDERKFGIRYGLAQSDLTDSRIAREHSLLRDSELWFNESELFPDPRKMTCTEIAKTLFSANPDDFKQWEKNQSRLDIQFHDLNQKQATKPMLYRGMNPKTEKFWKSLRGHYEKNEFCQSDEYVTERRKEFEVWEITKAVYGAVNRGIITKRVSGKMSMITFID